MKKIVGQMFLLGMIGMGQTALADEVSVLDEINTASCMIVSQGVHTALVERQAGTSKAKAQKVLDKDFKAIEKNFKKNPQFAQFVRESWSNGLDIVYNMPMQEGDEFRQAILRASFESCLNDLQSQ